MTVFGAGPAFDDLLDKLHDMGCPPPRFGRVCGEQHVWCNATLPAGTTERIALNLDACASAILTLDLSASDKDREAAESSLS